MSGAKLAIDRMCALAKVSRRGFYRVDPDRKPAERDLDLRDAIQRIALEMLGGRGSLPNYGGAVGR
jgi:hypothetical protein